MTYEPKPRVYLFGTGGTISFVGETRTDFANYSYHGRQLAISEMLARVPEAQSLAAVVAEQVINVGSTESLSLPLADPGQAHQRPARQRPRRRRRRRHPRHRNPGGNRLFSEPGRPRPASRSGHRRNAPAVRNGHRRRQQPA